MGILLNPNWGYPGARGGNAKLLSQVSSCQCQQMEVKHDVSVLDSGSLVRRRSRKVRKRADSLPSHLISKRHVALKIMYFGKRCRSKDAKIIVACPSAGTMSSTHNISAEGQ